MIVGRRQHGSGILAGPTLTPCVEGLSLGRTNQAILLGHKQILFKGHGVGPGTLQEHYLPQSYRMGTTNCIQQRALNPHAVLTTLPPQLPDQ